MGYRSDVTIALYPRGGKGATEFWPMVKLWAQENWPNDWCDIDYRDSSYIVVVTYNDIKWYPNYDFVEAAGAALEKFQETFDCNSENYRACYDFVRIGEETDDIETDHSDYTEYRLGVRSEVVVD